MATKKTEPYKLTLEDFSKEGYVKNWSVYVHPNITDLDRPVYRYMKFEHLLSMLKTKTIYVPNRSKFTDLSERGYKSELRNFGPYTMVPHNKKERQANKKYVEKVDAINKACQNVCISSWTYDLPISNNMDIKENFLMWKSYGYGDVSCRIETTIQKLIKSITDTDEYPILLSDVKYERERPTTGDAQTTIFNKTQYYTNERELRLCVLCDLSNYMLKFSDLTMIKEIVLSPFINYEYSKFLMEQLRTYFSNDGINIRKSRVMEYNPDIH